MSSWLHRSASLAQIGLSYCAREADLCERGWLIIGYWFLCTDQPLLQNRPLPLSQVICAREADLWSVRERLICQSVSFAKLLKIGISRTDRPLSQTFLIGLEASHEKVGEADSERGQIWPLSHWFLCEIGQSVQERPVCLSRTQPLLHRSASLAQIGSVSQLQVGSG